MAAKPQPPTAQELQEALRLAARHELWRKGDLDFLRDPTQLKIKAAVTKGQEEMHFLLCSRRLGKTYELILEAFEVALTKPKSRIVYLMPFAKDAATVATDTALKVLFECPDDIKPEWKGQDKEWHFSNGSIIRLKGTNGEHAKYLRGGEADLVILDECGMMDDLKHIVLDVVMPMTLTTNGRIIFATTPARSPGHESTAFYNDLADKGCVSLFTILDLNRPSVPESRKARFLVAAGETKENAEKILRRESEPVTTTARREYFCQFVTDADSAVLREFDAEARTAIVKEWKRPDFFDCYTAMDPGFNDKTGILFAYWDFANARLVIEGEALLSRAATPDIAKTVKEKERELWDDKPPLLRVTDIDLRLIADLWSLHGLHFVKADKADSEGAINLIRTMISRRELVVLPKCTGLIRQMTNAVYDSSGKDFDRDPVDSHYDLLAALKYLCRAINRQKNPFPAWYSRPAFGTWNSPKGRRPLDMGLLSDTPFGRQIARSQAKRRK